ncbi:MAG TPA: LL-diaminopimelate aminotransferase [Thermodesulfobacteriota bacterium]|nr:LL-diaminopimelate aminotransferase [Thermodesulfobacteriota bacterium]
MNLRWSKRIEELPPYLFAEIDAKKQEMKAKGVDLIDLGIGDPDIPTPKHIIDALKKAAEDPTNHRYPSYEGMLAFREAAANWYKQRFGVDLDPKTEVITLIGSKEGIAHTPLAFINPGDTVLVTDPGYPVYRVATTFAGGIPYSIPLLKKNNFLPDLDGIPEDVRRKAKLMFINYPNNPTSAVTDKEFFRKVVGFAHKHNIFICHDAAYTEVAFDGFKPPSFLEVDGAKEVGMEFHSLSKTFNMTGWRIGFAAGNSKAVAGLGKVKTNIDSGAFQAIQVAGIEALKNYSLGMDERRKIYEERRNIFCKGLDDVGISYYPPMATFYVWFEVPNGTSSKEFTAKLLAESGIVVTPGVGFGKFGEGYIRVSITIGKEKLAEAVERLKKVKL